MTNNFTTFQRLIQSVDGELSHSPAIPLRPFGVKYQRALVAVYPVPDIFGVWSFDVNHTENDGGDPGFSEGTSGAFHPSGPAWPREAGQMPRFGEYVQAGEFRQIEVVATGLSDNAGTSSFLVVVTLIDPIVAPTYYPPSDAPLISQRAVLDWFTLQNYDF